MIFSFHAAVSLVVAGIAALTFPSSIVAGDHDAKRSQRACSERSVRGEYAFYQYGEITTAGADGAGPAADVGVLVADGRGNMTGSEKLHRADGLIVDIQFCDGVYEVNENCMADFTWTAVIGESCEDPTFVIGERTATASVGKDQLYILSTTPETVLVGIGTRR
jgi:hypothetical protein